MKFKNKQGAKTDWTFDWTGIDPCALGVSLYTPTTVSDTVSNMFNMLAVDSENEKPPQIGQKLN